MITIRRKVTASQLVEFLCQLLRKDMTWRMYFRIIDRETKEVIDDRNYPVEQINIDLETNPSISFDSEQKLLTIKYNVDHTFKAASINRKNPLCSQTIILEDTMVEGMNLAPNEKAVILLNRAL